MLRFICLVVGLMSSGIIRSFVYIWIQQWFVIWFATSNIMQLSAVISYVNTYSTTKESVNVLPKHYNFVKIWTKPCISRQKSCTNNCLYSKTKLDVMQLYWSLCVIHWWFLTSWQRFVVVLGTNWNQHYVPTSVCTYSYLDIDIFTFKCIKNSVLYISSYHFTLIFKRIYTCNAPNTPGIVRCI